MHAARILFRAVAKRLALKKTYLTRSLTYKQHPLKLPVNADYIRYATLELCFEQIENGGVKGSVAELGVYKGDFAKRVNFLAGQRTFYLFDTFSGFDEKDISQERSAGYSAGNQDFSDTSVNMVLNKMPHPEKCIVKKGYFPETAIGVHDTFCFVSLDADLYLPILEGLRFFYPKLERGGFIFIHDFNNDQYKGARQAVLEYCRENNVGYVPLPDSGGTAIITK